MVSTLKPITAVECDYHKRLMSVEGCKLCDYVLEVRQPWRHFAVKCSYGDKHEAIYQ